MRLDTRQMETELTREIARLRELIAQHRDPIDPGAKCAVSFFKQLMRDKRERLALLRTRRA